MRRLTLVWIMALASAVLAAGPAAAERRLALVVGINDYRSLPPLVRAAGDARAVGAALTGLGFETTTLIEADRSRLDEVVAGFIADVAAHDVVVVHFAGHGTRIGGDFRLLPADAPAPGTARDALREAGGLGVIALADQIRTAGAAVQLVVVDACRGDPYAEGGAFQAGSACGALPRQPPDGTVVLFSAGTGQRALDRLGDNDGDTHSIFTRTLLKLLPQAATVPVVDLVRQVRDECAGLATSVRHEQRPAYLDEVQGDVTLALAPAPRQREIVASPPAPARPAPAPLDRYAQPAPAPVERYAPPPPAPTPAERYTAPAPAPRPSSAGSCGSVAPGSPAFNCARARTLVEVAICEDPGLGSCDRVLNRVFRNAERVLGPQNSLERDRDAWLGRREACGRAPDVNACIAHVYEERIAQLERVVAAPPPTATPAPPPSAPLRSAGPSFNCRYARSPVEIAICEDPGLAERDRQMARLFDRALALDPAGAGDIDGSQREWRAGRDRCSRLASSQGGSALGHCVAQAYDTRIRQLSGLTGER